MEEEKELYAALIYKEWQLRKTEAAAAAAAAAVKDAKKKRKDSSAASGQRKKYRYECSAAGCANHVINGGVCMKRQ